MNRKNRTCPNPYSIKCNNHKNIKQPIDITYGKVYVKLNVLLFCIDRSARLHESQGRIIEIELLMFGFL